MRVKHARASGIASKWLESGRTATRSRALDGCCDEAHKRCEAHSKKYNSFSRLRIVRDESPPTVVGKYSSNPLADQLTCARHCVIYAVTPKTRPDDIIIIARRRARALCVDGRRDVAYKLRTRKQNAQRQMTHNQR